MDEAENNEDILKENEMKIVELIMTLPPRKRLLLCMEKMMENKNQGKGMTKMIVPGVICHTSHPSHSIACFFLYLKKKVLLVLLTKNKSFFNVIAFLVLLTPLSHLKFCI